MRLQNIKNVSREDLLGLVGLKTKNSLRSWLGGSGLVGIGLPQAIVRLLHSSVGADGSTVIVRAQTLVVPQHWS